ncbi:MAG: DUF892 family protein, partial [Gemmatimonadota bacterium]|nr:DUF892 family protein [Gemmatimonadota bacterium]
RAAELFHDLAIVAADETVASVFRATAAESSIQLARVDRLIHSNGNAVLGAAATGNGSVPAGTRAGDADLLDAARDSVHHQMELYEAACVTSRRLGDLAALDVLLLNLDEERSAAAALNWQVSRQGSVLRAI